MRDDDDKKKEKKWRMEVHSWFGDKTKTGEWIRESVATMLKRTFEKHTRGAEWTKRKPTIVKVQVEELVYAHDGYRPKMEGEKKTRKSFWHRGARIWRD